MKNLATLKNMNNQVVIAMQAARLAAYENLKELGVEVPVRSDEDMQAEDCEDYDETERKGLYVYGPGKYYSLSEYRIDAVKAGEKGILCHYCEWNEHEADGWDALEEFYDCECILECIQWPDEVPDGEAEKEQETKERIMAIEFDCYNYNRRQTAKMTDVEKYYLWLERDEVKGYSLDEFSADFNDDNIATQSWLYFVDATACEKALKEGAKVELYLVWADNESYYEVPDGEPCIFKELEAAENQASHFAHEYDGEHERAIFHVDHLGIGETVSTCENYPNKCDK